MLLQKRVLKLSEGKVPITRLVAFEQRQHMLLNDVFPGGTIKENANTFNQL